MEANSHLDLGPNYDYVSLALSIFAPVKNGIFARKIIHLPRDFLHFCPKNGTFALVKKGTFDQETKQNILKSALNSQKGPTSARKSYKHCQKGSKGAGLHSIHT